MAYAALVSRALIGLVFAVSAFSKIHNIAAYREFERSLRRLPVPLAGNGALPAALAVAETAIVVLVTVPATGVAGLVLAALTLAVLTAGTAVAVKRGARVSCQCFGSSRAPLTLRHVLRNGFLLAVAVTGVLGTGAPGPRPEGIALSLEAALAVATLVVFLDDLVDLAGGDPVAAGPGAASSEEWTRRP